MRWIVILVIVGSVVFYLLSQWDNTPPKPAAVPPAPPAPQAAQVAPPRQQPPADPAIRLKQVAASVGVELRGYQPQEGGARVTVAWTGDVATLGGDFLEQCVRQGAIRDFDVNGQTGAAMENGRRVWIATYSVRY